MLHGGFLRQCPSLTTHHMRIAWRRARSCATYSLLSEAGHTMSAMLLPGRLPPVPEGRVEHYVRAANRCFSQVGLPHMHSRCGQVWSIRCPRGIEVPLLSCNVFSWLGGHLLPEMTAPLSVPFCNRLRGPTRPRISRTSSSPLLHDVSASSISDAFASGTSTPL